MIDGRARGRGRSGSTIHAEQRRTSRGCRRSRCSPTRTGCAARSRARRRMIVTQIAGPAIMYQSSRNPIQYSTGKNARYAIAANMPNRALVRSAWRSSRSSSGVDLGRASSAGGSSISRPTSSAGSRSRRIERERAAGGAHRVAALGCAVAARERGARRRQLGRARARGASRGRDRRRGSAARRRRARARSRTRSSRSSRGRAHADRVELGRDVAVGRAQRRPRVDAGERRSRAPAWPRGCSGCQREDLEQDAAERVDVGAAVEIGVAADLLRRHVAGRAEHGAGDRSRRRRASSTSPKLWRASAVVRRRRARCPSRARRPRRSRRA